MQLFRREWKSYRKSVLYWSIGLILMVFLAFYKIDSMSGIENGMESMMKVLPPVIQTMFGISADYSSPIALYELIHLYLLIALSFHAVILGSSLFAKEEHDKIFEFLYIKGWKRSRILCIKLLAGCSILILLNILSMTASASSLLILQKPVEIMELLPYAAGLFMAQLFFFSFTFCLTFLLPNNRKAGMWGCELILFMFLINIYVKLGGSIDFLNNLSIFNYMDAQSIKHGLEALPCIVLLLLSFGGFLCSFYLHEHRDLL